MGLLTTSTCTTLTTRATAVALYDAYTPPPAPQHTYPSPTPGLPPHRVQRIFNFKAAPPTGHYVDITDYIDLKVQALTSHRSQISDTERVSGFVREWAAKHGTEAGCEYAEAFRRLEVPQ